MWTTRVARESPEAAQRNPRGHPRGCGFLQDRGLTGAPRCTIAYGTRRLARRFNLATATPQGEMMHIHHRPFGADRLDRRRHSHPDHAASAQLHRRHLSDPHRLARAQHFPLGKIPDLCRLCRRCSKGVAPQPALETHGQTQIVPRQHQSEKPGGAPERPQAPRGQSGPESGVQGGQARPVHREQMGLQLRRRPRRGQIARCATCLGGKGAGLAEMANLGLPVPPGFTITTEVCTYYYGTARNTRPSWKPRSRRR